MFIHQIPSSSWGITPTLGVVTLFTFSISPIDWKHEGKLALSTWLVVMVGVLLTQPAASVTVDLIRGWTAARVFGTSGTDVSFLLGRKELQKCRIWFFHYFEMLNK